jgi:hypothetical protein
MMTQMVLSRGHVQPHHLPNTTPSLQDRKQPLCLTDNEDVMVMDTKLKIIEILQVSGAPPCGLEGQLPVTVEA